MLLLDAVVEPRAEARSGAAEPGPQAAWLGGARPPAVALGDAPNDVEMLNAADHGVIVANPHGSELPVLAGERAGRIRRSTKPGPAGWNEMILRLVSELTARSGD